MTSATETRRIVRAFHDARNFGDFETAGTHLAPAFTFHSPLLRYEDPAVYLASHAGFLAVVTGLDMISQLYGEGEATILYDLHTATPVGTQRTAEHFRLVDGRITEILLIFDASDWRPSFAGPG